MKITAKLLLSARACPEQVKLFRQTFPLAGAEPTQDNLALARSVGLDFNWCTRLLPPALDAEFRSRQDALDAEFRSRQDALDAEFQSRRGALYAEFRPRWGALDAEFRPRRDALLLHYLQLA